MSEKVQRCGRQSGVSYLEVLIAMALLAIMLAPMIDALRTASVSTDIHEQDAVQHAHLTAMLEGVLSESFGSLDAAATMAGSESIATSYSDLPGASDRRLVYLSLYDGDNADADNNPFSGTDPGLMWIRVEIEDTVQAVETLVSQ
ncbi:MAG: pilus assembly FimT family protein [Woeseiaceae bacterium]